MSDTPSELARLIGAAVDSARRSLGLRQEDMETRSGIPQTTWSRWMRGKGMGNLDHLDEGLRALGLDPVALLRPASSVSREAEDVARMWDAADPATREVVRTVLEARAREARRQSA